MRFNAQAPRPLLRRLLETSSNFWLKVSSGHCLDGLPHDRLTMWWSKKWEVDLGWQERPSEVRVYWPKFRYLICDFPIMEAKVDRVRLSEAITRETRA